MGRGFAKAIGQFAMGIDDLATKYFLAKLKDFNKKLSFQPVLMTILCCEFFFVFYFIFVHWVMLNTNNGIRIVKLIHLSLFIVSNFKVFCEYQF